ncbi:pectate lyase [Dickeya sp. DW 0440]|uniref:pectate lyase n=1 Tax=Dickeya sp. DW 0440 TaxID=1225785 RepID=UPI0003A8EDE0|nr:pectate lyase [Dickeya sp. DW 0440]
MADISITISIPRTGLNGGVGGTDALNNSGIGNKGGAGAPSQGQDKLLQALAVVLSALLPGMANNGNGQPPGNDPLGRSSDALGGQGNGGVGGLPGNSNSNGSNGGLPHSQAGGSPGQNALGDLLTRLMDILMPKDGSQSGQGLQNGAGGGLSGTQGSGGASGSGASSGPEELSKSLLQDAGESTLGNGISPTQDGGGQISDNPLLKILLSLIAMMMENQKNQFGQPQEGGGNGGGAAPSAAGPAIPSVGGGSGSSAAPSAAGQATPSVGGGSGGGAAPSAAGTATPSVGGGSSSADTGKAGAVAFPVADNANAIVVNKPITVGPGEVFDGKGKTYVAGPGLGDGSQKEGQKPLFEVANGGSVKNVIFGNNAADGIHLHGDAKIDNVHWTNVGEDALTVKSNTGGKPANVTITNSSAQGASDKVFQLNADANFKVDNFKVKDFGTFVRTNGGQQGNWNLNLSNIDAQNGKFSFVKSDSEGLNVNVKNANLDNVNNHYKVPKSTHLQVS